MSFFDSSIFSKSEEHIRDFLCEQGIRTVTAFLTQDFEDLVKKKSQYNVPAVKDLNNVRKQILLKYSSPVVTGLDLVQATKTIITTGSQSLDKLLDGGIYSGEVTEICGGIAVGKTQLCMSCVCKAASKGHSVYYIDTASSFSATRLVQLVGENNQNLETILNCVQHKVCSDIFEIFEVLEHIKSILIKDGTYKLVIIDCIASVIYPILGGNQIDGHGLLVQLGHKLKVLAVEYNIAVLISNNVVYGEGGKAVPSLGRTWSHVPHTRLLLTNHRHSHHSSERTVSLIKSTKQTIPASTVINIPSGIG